MEYDITVEHGHRSTSRLLIPSSQTKLSESQSQKSHLNTTGGILSQNPTSTSILGFNIKTNTLRDTMGVNGSSQATSSSLRQLYTAVTAAYDTCIEVVDSRSDYQELRMGLMIERYRLDLWRRYVLADDETEQGNLPTYDIGWWALFESLLLKMLETFAEHHHTMERHREQNSIPKQEGLAAVPRYGPPQAVDNSRERPDLLESMSIFTRWPLEIGVMISERTFEFGLLEMKSIQRLLQTLCYCNNSLDGLTSTLERESARRRLRAHFSTSNTAELQTLEAAAAFLRHQDIECMANARTVIEEDEYGGPLGPSQLQASENLSSSPRPVYQLKVDNLPSYPPPEYRLSVDELEWQESPYATDRMDRTDRTRAMATLRGESVIVDWQYCEDDSWRRLHRAAFRRRTQNVATILNTGLRPLNLSVLHCVGYLERDSKTTGYAFRLPPGVEPGQRPVSLHHLLYDVNKPNEIPDLGERFQLAKALVSTVFEIHNLGWLHKNIQPKNILFWPKPDSKGKIDIGKPYLMGFDISRPNQPGEFTEKPLACHGDDLYRHPLYRSAERHAFQPSFDIYSLGIVLYEIGFWRHIAAPSHVASGRSRWSRASPNFSSQLTVDLEYIDNLVKNSAVNGLERYMGRKYRDVVLACFQSEFDDIWEKQEEDREKRLRDYLDYVQSKIVDAIGVCSA